MSEMIQRIALGDLVTLRSGHPFRSAQWSSTGVRVVKIANVKSGELDFSTESFVSAEDAESASNSRLRHGDILLAMTGYVGDVARVRTREPLVLNQRVGRFQIHDLDRLSPEFLFNFLRLPATREKLVARAHGSAQPNLSANAVHELIISLPTLSEQRAIAEVLGALDDKIAANTNLITAADALMHTHFRVAAARGTAEPLSGSAEFINGRAFTKNASGTGRVVIRIAELNSGIGGSTVFSDAEVADVHVARPGDILFAWSGSLTLHRWFREPGIVNQHIFKVIPSGNRPSWLVYELVRAKLDEFKAIAANKATTMGHIQRRHLDEPVLVPPAADLERLSPLMEGLWQTTLTAERENLTLAATRDALLPQLMSGKLQIKDAESLVADAM